MITIWHCIDIVFFNFSIIIITNTFFLLANDE